MDTHIQARLLEITSDENMRVLKIVANALIDSWNKQSAIGSNEFETVKNTIGKEERRKALELFIEQLESSAHGE